MSQSAKKPCIWSAFLNSMLFNHSISFAHSQAGKSI